MNPATSSARYGPSHDPYFHGVDEAPDKGNVPHANPGRRRRRRIRSRIIVVGLAVIWFWILLDPVIGPLFLGLFMWIAGTLALVGAAMGLGLLGFGLCTTVDRFIGWLRRSASWPEE